MNQIALIVYHKQTTSARTRFLRSPCSCLFYADFAEGVTPHPGSVVRQVAESLGIKAAALELHDSFRETDSARRTVYLARATTIDPPETYRPEEYCFVSLMDARELPPMELDLLGAAYRSVMGG